MADSKEIAVKASVDIGTNIADLVEKLAHQIGTTADKVFPWYVKEQILEGYLYLALCVLTIVIMFIIGYFSIKIGDKRKDDLSVPLVFVGGCALVLSAIALILLILGASGSITQIMNPEYYALKSMTSDMSKLLGK